MRTAQEGTVVECVQRTVKSLEIVESRLRDLRKQTGTADEDAAQDAVKTVEEHAKLLHEMIKTTSTQRVLMLPADQLMEAGIVLYNAARATYKAYQATIKDGDQHDTCNARFPILFVRFMAARVMGLALSCSKSGVGGVSAGHAHDQSVLVNDCLDVLRSYGRVGSLLIETAAKDTSKCFEYLTLAKEALDYASSIWSQVGLSCLTRFKEGLELEEVLQDLWDFCVDRVRAVRLLQSYVKDSMAVTVIIETLHELQMLLPYMLDNTKNLLQLIQDTLNEWNSHDCHSDLVILAEESLRLCDAAEATQDVMTESCVTVFRESYLKRLLCSLVSLNEVEKAEACFTLLGPAKDSSTFLSMVKLYLDSKENDKAAVTLKGLFQRDDVAVSIAGARMFVEANTFSEDSMKVYRQLERHYGDHVLDISLDLACALAVSDLEQNRVKALAEARRIWDMMASLPRASIGSQVARMKQMIHDAAGSAMNSNSIEECAAWVELGVQQSISPQETAAFKRIVAAACLKVGQISESRRWAQEAMDIDPSAASLLSVFEASLNVDVENGDLPLTLLRQVKERDDFEPQDLVSFGYAANCAGREDLMLEILDDLCNIVGEGGAKIKELPFGMLLQNTAQLALRATTTSSGDPSGTPKSYSMSFVKYANMFCEAARNVTQTETDCFASEATFVWFYTMSFNVARSCSLGSLFVRAADISKEAQRLFGTPCAIADRELECLLAALSFEMAKFDSVDPVALGTLLGTVARLKAFSGIGSEHEDFLAKSELAIRLRMFDPDVELLRNLCESKLQHHFGNFIDAGELILKASRFDEADGIRHPYRTLAKDTFKRGLQLLLQSESIDQTQLSYLLRRLVMLSDTREETYEWFEQFLQLSTSIDIRLPELDSEWFIAKAWNMGVQFHRSQSYGESQKFMRMALRLSASVGSTLSDLARDLHEQYQELSVIEKEDILTVD